MGPRTVPGFSFVCYRQDKLLVLLASLSPVEMASLPAPKKGVYHLEYRVKSRMTPFHREHKTRKIKILQWQKTC
jgi:hypothetical protein